MTEKPILNTNEEENKIIKSTFKDNDFLLKAMRALFLGLELTDDEKTLIKSTFSDKGLLRIIYKKFLPTLDKESPIGQVQDIWLGVEQMVFGMTKETIYQAINYKELALNMTARALALLENPNGERIDVSFNPMTNINDEYGINLLARNQYIRHVESQLMFLKVIAEQKEEDTKEQQKRIAQNSAR